MGAAASAKVVGGVYGATVGEEGGGGIWAMMVISSLGKDHCDEVCRACMRSVASARDPQIVTLSACALTLHLFHTSG
jgi:hypothetical protein